LAVKLYSGEIAGISHFKPLTHLLKNHRKFFTRGLDDVSIKAVNLFMMHYCKNPKLLRELTEVREKFASYCFSGREERLLTIDITMYTPSQLVQLNSCFLLLNNASA
jgi:hypothetical protein